MKQYQTDQFFNSVAIIGRPNVGKSTLFNRLVGRRRAITDPLPGVTRDTIEEICTLGDLRVTIIDTGGYRIEGEELDHIVAKNSLRAAEKADLLLFVMDVNEINGDDYFFIEEIRKFADKTILVINKVDNEKREEMAWNFYSLGFENVIPVSAAHGRNIDILKTRIEEFFNSKSVNENWKNGKIDEQSSRANISLSILGKPNTGKSTLLNRLIGMEKAMVSDAPGTTRDTVEGIFSFRGVKFRVIDTAGIRRKKKIEERVEYYSVNRAIKSIGEADIVYLIIDATEGLSEQDKKIANLAVNRGRGIILVLNKWDTVNAIPNQMNAMSDRIKYQFPVLSYAPIVNISALRGTGLERLLDVTLKVWKQLNFRVETSKLNNFLKKWLEEYPIPVRGKNVKIMYATQISVNPIHFIFFVNNRHDFPSLYLRYLENRIRKDLKFDLVPLSVEIRLR